MAFIKSSPGLSCKMNKVRSGSIIFLVACSEKKQTKKQKKQIPLVLVGYGMILANSVLHAFLAVHHLVFKACLSPKVTEKNGDSYYRSNFCTVYDYQGKANLSMGYWNPQRKLGVAGNFFQR